MKITINGIDIRIPNIPQLETFASARRFPHFLIIAGGKVLKDIVSAKFRVTAIADATVLKEWNEVVEITDVDGDSFGQIFEGALQKADDVDYNNLEFRFEIDTGAGFEDVDPANNEFILPINSPAPLPNIQGFYAEVITTDGKAAGLVGLLVVR